MDNKHPEGFRGDILVVDDHIPSLRSLTDLLLGLGYQVRSARDGESALMMVKTELPDLIILDIRMPDMDGYQVCQAVKSLPGTTNIPVIFVSGLDDVVDIVHAFDVGGVDYILKPFKVEEVEARVNTHLALSQLQQKLALRNAELEREILHREQVQTALKASEASLRAQYQSIPIPTYTWQVKNDDLMLVDYNDAAAQITQQKIKDFIGLSASELYHNRPDILTTLYRCAQERKASIEQDIVYTFLTTGECKDLAVKYAFVPPDLVLVHTEDITARKRAEEELRSSRQFVQSSLDALSAHIAILEENGVIVAVNQSWRNFADQNNLGWDHYGIGKNYLEITDQASEDISSNSSAAARGIREVIGGQRDAFSLEYPCHSPDQERWFIMRVTRFESNQGNRIVVSHNDITDRVQAEKGSLYQKHLLQTLMDTTSDYIYFKDRNGKYVRISNSFGELFTLNFEEIIGKTDEELYPPQIWETTVRDDRKVIETGNSLINKEEEWQLIGENRPWMLTSKIPWYDNDGEIIGLFGISKDITDVKRIELELRERTIELGERVKELNCLYGISALVQQPGISLDEILQGAVELMPPAWQYPDLACARIVLYGKQFTTPNFHKSAWGQTSDIKVYAQPCGSVEVYYLKEMPAAEEGPFLQPERSLLDAIAERLGRIVERFTGEENLKRYVDELSSLNRIAKAMATTTNPIEHLEFVSEIVAGLLRARLALFTVPVSGDQKLQMLAGYERDKGSFTTVNQTHKLTDIPVTRQSLQTGDTIILSDLPSVTFPEYIAPHVVALNLQVFMLVPLKTVGDVVGLLILGFDEPGREISANEQALAETIANDIAGAIENARLVDLERLTAVNEERQRLARELHDSATQSIYSLVLLSSGWESMARQGILEDVADSFRQLGNVGLQALKEMRLLLHQLRPDILDEVGLVQAIQTRLDNVELKANIKPVLVAKGNLDDLSSELESELFYIVQEALNNSLRHAQAEDVKVEIIEDRGRIQLLIEDNGQGFDWNTQARGMGLKNMAERANAIGGEVLVESEIDQGTKVRVAVDINRKQEESR